jgi:hypothetical protein
MVDVECPHCGTEVALDDDEFGAFICPHCDIEFEGGTPPSESEEIEIEVTSFSEVFSLWMITLVWCGISFVIAGFVISDILYKFETENWNPADAVVLDSWVVEGNDEASGTFCLWAEYEYEFDGVEYIGLDEKTPCTPENENSDEDYPVGKGITIFVDPDNPSESSLTQGIEVEDQLIYCFFILPFIGIILIAYSIRSTVDMFKGVERPRI